MSCKIVYRISAHVYTHKRSYPGLTINSTGVSRPTHCYMHARTHIHTHTHTHTPACLLKFIPTTSYICLVILHTIHSTYWRLFRSHYHSLLHWLLHNCNIHHSLLTHQRAWACCYSLLEAEAHCDSIGRCFLVLLLSCMWILRCIQDQLLHSEASLAQDLLEKLCRLECRIGEWTTIVLVYNYCNS